MKTLCTVLNCHCILTLAHGHAYLQNLIFQQKRASFLKKKKRQLLKKLMSESGSTLKAKVMLRWTNFAHTFIYLEIFVSISPRRSSILFVKDFSFVPKFSYGEMINK